MIGPELEGVPANEEAGIIFAIDAEKIYKSVGQPSGTETFEPVDTPIYLRTGQPGQVLVVRDHDRRGHLRSPSVREWSQAETHPSLASRDSGRLETYILINTTTITELDLDGFGEYA